MLFINPLCAMCITRINALWSRVSTFLNVLTVCGLHYHVYLILTYSCLEHRKCYLLTMYRLDFYV